MVAFHFCPPLHLTNKRLILLPMQLLKQLT